MDDLYIDGECPRVRPLWFQLSQTRLTTHGSRVPVDHCSLTPSRICLVTITSALGIADEVNALEARGTKKKKGRKMDEDFTPTLHPIQLAEVPKVSSATRQAIQNRRILVKLLMRIQMTRDSVVRFALLRLHGFNLMSHILREYPDDLEIVKLVSFFLRGRRRPDREARCDHGAGRSRASRGRC
jgi:hypothetical protein